MLVPVPGLDPSALPLRPFEGHVLFHIDGRRSVVDLAREVGRPLEELQPILERLLALGAVRWSTRPPSARSSAPRSEPGRPQEPPLGSTETDEAVALSPEQRREILDLYDQLDRLDHYAVLGVSRDADRAAIRRAYFERSKRFHPDTFYGKELGSYKARLQAIFDRLTKAYETLSRRKKRDAYDRYLASFDATREAGALLDEPSRGGTGATSSDAPSRDGVAAAGSGRSRDEAARLRRRRAARRLRGVLRSSFPSRPPADASRISAREAARRLEAASGRVVKGGEGEARRRERLLEELAEQARRQAESERWVEALRALQRLAVLEPSHGLLDSMLPEARKQVAARLAEEFAARARYEEEQAQWALAAVSWSRVHEGRPGDAEAAWRAARCLLEAQGDTKQAQRLAMEAVRLAPRSAEAHLVLGRAYREMGMRLNALRELREALRLRAKEPRLAAWIRELERAEVAKPRPR